MHFSGPQTPKSSQTSSRMIDKEDAIRVEAVEIDNGVEEFVDPEAVNVGHRKRPMILTHSVMVGLTLIILIVIEAIVISKVRTQE